MIEFEIQPLALLQFAIVLLVFLQFSIGFLWFAISLLMYTFMLGSPNIGGNMYISFLFSVLGDFPPYLLSPYLSSRLGRKKTVLGGAALCGVLTGCMGAVPRSSYYVNILLMVLAKMAGMFVNHLYFVYRNTISKGKFLGTRDHF